MNPRLEVKALPVREAFFNSLLICIDPSSFPSVDAACWEQSGRHADGWSVWYSRVGYRM